MFGNLLVISAGYDHAVRTKVLVDGVRSSAAEYDGIGNGICVDGVGKGRAFTRHTIQKYTAALCKGACNMLRHCIGYSFADYPDKTCDIIGANVADNLGVGWRKTSGLGTAPIVGITKSATVTCFRKPTAATGVCLVFCTSTCAARSGT